MADNKNGGAGLRGQVAGKTAICTVAAHGHSGLTYYGYDISELAKDCIFEEVAYLLLEGELPNRSQLQDFQASLVDRRKLPIELREVLERIPSSAHPMDVMRTGISMLGNLETETDFSQQKNHAMRMLATLPAIVAYWYRFANGGTRIETESECKTIGGHFLHLLHGKKPNNIAQF